MSNYTGIIFNCPGKGCLKRFFSLSDSLRCCESKVATVSLDTETHDEEKIQLQIKEVKQRLTGARLRSDARLEQYLEAKKMHKFTVMEEKHIWKELIELEFKLEVS